MPAITDVSNRFLNTVHLPDRIPPTLAFLDYYLNATQNMQDSLSKVQDFLASHTKKYNSRMKARLKTKFTFSKKTIQNNNAGTR